MNKIKNFYDAYGYFLPINVISSKMALEASNKIEKISKNPISKIKHPWNLQAHLLANWIYSICSNCVFLFIFLKL